MAKVRVHNFTITLDGFSAGVNQRICSSVLSKRPRARMW